MFAMEEKMFLEQNYGIELLCVALYGFLYTDLQKIEYTLLHTYVLNEFLTAYRSKAYLR